MVATDEYLTYDLMEHPLHFAALANATDARHVAKAACSMSGKIGPLANRNRSIGNYIFIKDMPLTLLKREALRLKNIMGLDYGDEWGITSY